MLHSFENHSENAQSLYLQDKWTPWYRIWFEIKHPRLTITYMTVKQIRFKIND